MDTSIPTRTTLKAQAKRLRTSLSEQGKTVSHAQSLETIAQQYGMRDWNTLHAASHDNVQSNALTWQIGQTVAGRYLGQLFTGQIKSATSTSLGFWKLTVVFENAVDVVTSEHFSNLRRQVNCTVGSDGRSVQKTSDGIPHIVLES